MKEDNESENFKIEKSILLTNKNALENEKSRVILNEAKQKYAEKEKKIKTPLYDVMKISEFLNDHIKNLQQDLNESAEIRFGNKEDEKDMDYLDVIKDFKKEKLLDNNMFFFNGKEFNRNPPQKAKKGIKFNKNILADKNTVAYRINPITKCQINFSDDDDSDVNHNSDIDVYLED